MLRGPLRPTPFLLLRAHQILKSPPASAAKQPPHPATSNLPTRTPTPTAPGKTVLEVERKFPALAVPSLSPAHCRGYAPAFGSVTALPARRIHDVYYDTASHALCAAGTWVRLRDGRWEAKLRRGGDFVNSRFEELAREDDITRCVRAILGDARPPREKFGLRVMAEFTTTREAWLCDGEFRVVRDRMDFGHEVGEVELQVAVDGLMGEGWKEREMERMDARIAGFMERYRWAFDCSRGEAKGKLTAWFEMVEKDKNKER
ncbi:hypothetical protein MFIFM68171_08936 [Madurella fahalii]|uniref:Thiamine-triphosphatase n=1 Tax=Madurella fahalii TaxID=1157608 RepID=A0ABQ0GLY6_9PEZI